MTSPSAIIQNHPLQGPTGLGSYLQGFAQNIVLIFKKIKVAAN